MRVKKQKRHRKVVRFYAACFGFREPFKVLLDGTFVHHLLHHGLSPADVALSRLLGSRSLLFTSKCVVAELRRIGPSHSNAFEAAQQLITARCDHEKAVNAATCIQSLIRGDNAEHFFVATQDADLRKKFHEVPGVPVIYGLKNSLFLEQPSLRERGFVKLAEEKRMHMNELEYQKVHKRELTGISAEDSVEKQTGTINITRRVLGVAEKSKFKRKRAKGPNPLSCKKKKERSNSSATQNQDAQGEGAAKRKRIRKRRGSHGDKKPPSTVLCKAR